MREDPPDLVLLNIMMPRKSGVAVFKRMRADPDLEKIPHLPVGKPHVPFYVALLYILLIIGVPAGILLHPMSKARKLWRLSS